jgi:hypothetical protein
MQTHNQKLTPKSIINTLVILHLVFTLCPLFFGLYVLLISYKSNPNFDNYSDPFLFILIVMGIISVLLSNYLYKTQINSLREKTVLSEKLNGFTVATLIRYAPLEGTSLFIIFIANNYFNPFYLVVPAFLIVCLSYRRPTKYKIERDLELNNVQKNKLNKTDEIIN